MLLRDIAREAAGAYQRATTAHLAGLPDNPFEMKQVERDGLLATRVGVLRGVRWINDVRGLNESNLRSLDEVLALYDGGPPPMLRLWASLLTPELGAALHRRGFTVGELSTLLAAEKPTSQPTPAHIEVARGSDARTHAQLVTDGFTPIDALQHDIMRAEIEQPNLHRYVGLVDGVAAGGASMLTTDRGCFFAGASTLPAHRGRGVQSALIAARFADLAGRPAVVTTGYATGSQRNLERLGLRLVDLSLSYLKVV